LYQVLPVDGKGLGCIASKEIKMGTLILHEIPQFVLPENITKSELSIEFMSKLMDSYNKMSKSDQEQFLNLHNRFEGDDSFDEFIDRGSNNNLWNIHNQPYTFK